MNKKRKLIIGGVILAAIVVAVAVIGLILPNKKQSELDTSGALLSVTQNGDTIAFYPDDTYAIQGDVEIQGVVFDYEVKSTYNVEDGTLTLGDAAPTVSVSSKFGDFEVAGDVDSAIKDGALVIHLEGSNETDTFELAHLELGKDQAEKIKVKGVTADSWEDGKKAKKKSGETKKKETVLDEEGALLSVESAGNKIAFFPDDTFQIVAGLTQSDGGLTVDYTIEIKDKYSVKDGKLILPESLTCIWNADIFAQYGRTDVEGPGRCTVDIVDGLLELHFYGDTAGGEVEIARFKIGKEDAEKIGVEGVTGDTVNEEKATGAANTTATGGTNNAPAQPAIAADAKPISFSNGGYTVTFYSNGQYTESGSTTVQGTVINVNVTDTYTIDSGCNLQMATANQTTCNIPQFNTTFPAPNNTSCTPQNGGYLVNFAVFANNQNYELGSVTLSASDVQRIQANFGLAGEAPTTEPEPEKPQPEKPGTEPTSDGKVIKLTSKETGMILSLNLKDKTYDISGKFSYENIDLIEYSLVKPAKYSTKNNKLTFKPATVKMKALNDMAKDLEGEYPAPITAVKGEKDSLILTLQIMDQPYATFKLTKKQAKSLGLDMSKYEEAPPAPVEDSYTPDTTKTAIAFDKSNKTYTIAGAGKYTFNGMQADLAFQVVDSYTVGDGGIVTPANTANTLTYVVAVSGQVQQATLTPETTIVREGTGYKVTLNATINGKKYTLAEGTVETSAVVEDIVTSKLYQSTNGNKLTLFSDGNFSLEGSCTLDYTYTDPTLQIPVTLSVPVAFSVNDTCTIGDDGTVTPDNNVNTLRYTAYGTPGEAPITPSTIRIVREGTGYKVTLVATVPNLPPLPLLDGETFTLVDGTRNVAKAAEVSHQVVAVESSGAQNASAPAKASEETAVDTESAKEAESEKEQSEKEVAMVPEQAEEKISDSSEGEDSDEEDSSEEDSSEEDSSEESNAEKDTNE